MGTPAVEAALRTASRYVFVPYASVEDAYANAPVHIKYDTAGTSISCASWPGVVALILDQLGADTGIGYNAALFAHLVGESGLVTTLDVDDDLVEGACCIHLTPPGSPT